jgi:hypothetical protein
MEIKYKAQYWLYLVMAVFVFVSSIIGTKAGQPATYGSLGLLASLVAVSLAYQVAIIDTLKDYKNK